MTTSNIDLIVIGSGAAGLSAAVTAAASGLRVTLLEKADVLGGTTAWSGGWIWAPGNPVVKRAGVKDRPEDARLYLQAVMGNRFDPERIDAFLAGAPAMIDFLEQEAGLAFDPGSAIPDTYGDLPGAGTGGRSVIARAFDGRALGADIALLRKPLPETSFLGMTIQAGPDLRAFMTMTRSAPALYYACRRVLRHLRDLALHGRGMELRNGNALVARLLQAARARGVKIHTGVEVAALERAAPPDAPQGGGGPVTGLRLRDGSGLACNVGVVLACGGFPHDTARRAALFPRDGEHRSLAVPEATGDGLALAEDLGATVTTDLASPAALCPVSHVPWPDGRSGGFPHIIERGKPGLIAVLRDGRRFCNEGLGYHDYVEALLRAVPPDAPARSWLICDHRFLRHYGLGIVRPRPLPWRPWVRRGYPENGPNHRRPGTGLRD
ncbi:FAD-dependent oxidoreductase [Pseudooceanicola sp. HF7]|uniref:FAD-dependent oxidoreductase n=1 Tax=Pseudooceanicola sp. HF7 TaxID=2721560 RepID=UPI0020CA5F4A|nr:FAD-dependent oxidoreductase [Pseudooceanicola sp. HF7]